MAIAAGDEKYIGRGDSNTDGSVRLLYGADNDGDGIPDAKLQHRVNGAWLDLTQGNPTAGTLGTAALSTALVSPSTTGKWRGGLTGEVATALSSELGRVLTLEALGGGTAVADNQAALSAAIDRANETGKEIVLGPGSYTLLSAIIKTSTVRNFTIRGQGMDRTTILCGSTFANQTLFSMTAAQTGGRIIFVDLTIDCSADNSATGTDNGGTKNITAVNYADGQITCERVRIASCLNDRTNAGTKFQGHGLFLSNVKNSRIVQCEMDLVRRGVSFSGDCQDCIVEHTKVTRSWDHHFYCTGVITPSIASCQRITFRDCEADNHIGHLHLFFSDISTGGVRHKDLSFINCKAYGKDLSFTGADTGGTADLLSVNYVDGALIEGCLARNSGDFCIVLANCSNGRVVGCEGSRANSGGIAVWNCENSVVSASKAFDCNLDRAAAGDKGLPRAGIAVYGGSNGVTVAGCVSGNTGANTTQQYGLMVVSRGPNAYDTNPVILGVATSMAFGTKGVAVGQNTLKNNAYSELYRWDDAGGAAVTIAHKSMYSAFDPYFHLSPGAVAETTDGLQRRSLFQALTRANGASASAATAIPVTTGVVVGIGLLVGDYVKIRLDDGVTWHNATLTAVPGTASLAITPGLPSSIAGGNPILLGRWKLERPGRQTIAYAASITPDLLSGNLIEVGSLTGAITVNNPTSGQDGDVLEVLLAQDATGGRVVTWGSKLKTALGASGTASQRANVQFRYSSTKDLWIQNGLYGWA